jgi:hypothetical protein
MLKFLADSEKAFSFFSSVFYLSVLKVFVDFFYETIVGRTEGEKKIVYKLCALETVALRSKINIIQNTRVQTETKAESKAIW